MENRKLNEYSLGSSYVNVKPQCLCVFIWTMNSVQIWGRNVKYIWWTQDKTQTKRHDVSLIEEKRKFNGGIFCNLESSSWSSVLAIGYAFSWIIYNLCVYVNHIFFLFASYLYHIYIIFVSYSHFICIIFVSYLYHICFIFLSYLYHICIIFVSYLYHILYRICVIFVSFYIVFAS